MSLVEFNKKYKYVSDKDKYGFIEVWTEPKEENGRVEGDCEDYAIYLKRNIPEFSQWHYYRCKLNGIGHCVLSDGMRIIDCNCKKVMTKEEYIKLYIATDLKKFNWFVVGSKFFLGYGVTTVHRIKKWIK